MSCFYEDGMDFKCFLLTIGLYENISSLEDEKLLTFLYRAPKIFLDSLSVYKKRLSNKGIIDISSRGVLKMKLPRFENFVLFNFEELV